jgi:hypothetical protein
MIGALVLAWDGCCLFTGRMGIPAGAGLNTAAFLWGYGFLSAFPQRELAIFAAARRSG